MRMTHDQLHHNTDPRLGRDDHHLLRFLALVTILLVTINASMISIDSYLPKTVQDTAAFLFLLFGVFTTFVFETTTVLPHVYPNSLCWPVFHSVVGLYIVHGILGNLYFLMTTDSSIRNVLLPTTLLQGWKFCSVCESNSPVRASHCKTCDVCVLKRSHHCLFAGRCVGYKNCRYFVSMLLHLCIGTLYASVLNQFFIWDLLNGLSVYTILCHLFPAVFLILGHISFKTAVFCFISVIDVAGGLFSLGLLLYHMSLILTNQTIFERSRRITSYDLKEWKQNVYESLGEKWLLVWFSPLVTSRLPRDGLTFPTHEFNRLEARKGK